MAQVMTESQVPTDALARLRHLYSNLVNGGVRDTASAKRIAEGLLAPVIEDLERRTSAPVGVGEVAERYRNAIASACEGWTMPDGLRKHLETALWSPPTPQPTQAQAAEPVAVVVPCYTPSGKRVALCSAKQDLPIGTKLYAAPQPSPTTHPADSVQEEAARYRWLRDGNDAKHGAAWHVAVNLYGCEWDAAIDAARKRGASHDR